MLGIDELGHSKKSDLTLLTFPQERGRDDVSRLIVSSGRNAVQLSMAARISPKLDRC